MHKISNFSANSIVISEKNVIFALVLRTNDIKRAHRAHKTSDY